MDIINFINKTEMYSSLPACQDPRLNADKFLSSTKDQEISNEALVKLNYYDTIKDFEKKFIFMIKCSRNEPYRRLWV